MAPVVSVCVPVRNHARFLREAVASALAQRGVELEVLVHDDASTDGPPPELPADGRLRYRRHPSPLGVAGNRNSLLAAARGRYVAWLDADDAYLPGALARQVAALEEAPSAGIVHGAFEVVDERGGRLPDWPAPFDRDTVEPSSAAFLNLLGANEITTSTVVVRRDCLPGFTDGASSSDWAAWLRVALRADVAYTAAPVARYRRHANSISSATSASGERLRCDLAVVRRLLREERARLPDAAADVASAALAAKALAHAGDLFTRGDRAGSMRAVALAVRLAPRCLGRCAPRMLASTARGDAHGCYRTNKAMLERLAEPLAGLRLGERLRAAAATDPAWEATLRRAAAAVRRVVPRDACLGAVTKWDPTLLALSGRDGVNFPGRAALPDGYPRDGAAAVEHLEEMRGHGVSHLVFPSASFWWLDHYPDLAEHLARRHRRLWRDDDCMVFELQ